MIDHMRFLEKTYIPSYFIDYDRLFTITLSTLILFINMESFGYFYRIRKVFFSFDYFVSIRDITIR